MWQTVYIMFLAAISGCGGNQIRSGGNKGGHSTQASATQIELKTIIRDDDLETTYGELTASHSNLCYEENGAPQIFADSARFSFPTLNGDCLPTVSEVNIGLIKKVRPLSIKQGLPGVYEGLNEEFDKIISLKENNASIFLSKPTSVSPAQMAFSATRFPFGSLGSAVRRIAKSSLNGAEGTSTIIPGQVAKPFKVKEVHASEDLWFLTLECVHAQCALDEVAPPVQIMVNERKVDLVKTAGRIAESSKQGSIPVGKELILAMRSDAESSLVDAMKEFNWGRTSGEIMFVNHQRIETSPLYFTPVDTVATSSPPRRERASSAPVACNIACANGPTSTGNLACAPYVITPLVIQGGLTSMSYVANGDSGSHSDGFIDSDQEKARDFTGSIQWPGKSGDRSRVIDIPDELLPRFTPPNTIGASSFWTLNDVADKTLQKALDSATYIDSDGSLKKLDSPVVIGALMSMEIEDKRSSYTLGFSNQFGSLFNKPSTIPTHLAVYNNAVSLGSYLHPDVFQLFLPLPIGHPTHPTKPALDAALTNLKDQHAKYMATRPVHGSPLQIVNVGKKIYVPMWRSLSWSHPGTIYQWVLEYRRSIQSYAARSNPDEFSPNDVSLTNSLTRSKMTLKTRPISVFNMDSEVSETQSQNILYKHVAMLVTDKANADMYLWLNPVNQIGEISIVSQKLIKIQRRCVGNSCSCPFKVAAGKKVNLLNRSHANWSYCESSLKSTNTATPFADAPIHMEYEAYRSIQEFVEGFKANENGGADYATEPNTALDIELNMNQKSWSGITDAYLNSPSSLWPNVVPVLDYYNASIARDPNAYPLAGLRYHQVTRPLLEVEPNSPMYGETEISIPAPHFPTPGGRSGDPSTSSHYYASRNKLAWVNRFTHVPAPYYFKDSQSGEQTFSCYHFTDRPECMRGLPLPNHKQVIGFSYTIEVTCAPQLNCGELIQQTPVLKSSERRVVARQQQLCIGPQCERPTDEDINEVEESSSRVIVGCNDASVCPKIFNYERDNFSNTFKQIHTGCGGDMEVTIKPVVKDHMGSHPIADVLRADLLVENTITKKVTISCPTERAGDL